MIVLSSSGLITNLLTVTEVIFVCLTSHVVNVMLVKFRKVPNLLVFIVVCNCFCQGVYTVERITDMSWLLLSLGMLFIYHYIVLQGLALVSCS